VNTAARSDQPVPRPGRPPEDRFQRQREIFEAVAPLLSERGARRLTMRDAATAACLSVGGLNHYFPTKADLLFWPLVPEICEAAHQDFLKQHGWLQEHDPAAFFLEFVNDTVSAIVEYCTPAIQAALELGADEFWEVMDAGMTPTPLVASFEATRQPLDDDQRDRLIGGIRRVFIGATLDPRVTRAELLSDVWTQLESVSARPPSARASALTV